MGKKYFFAKDLLKAGVNMRKRERKREKGRRKKRERNREKRKENMYNLDIQLYMIVDRLVHQEKKWETFFFLDIRQPQLFGQVYFPIKERKKQKKERKKEKKKKRKEIKKGK